MSTATKTKKNYPFIPTERQTIEWEQEDAIFDMLDVCKDWMTIEEMVAWGPQARSLQHHILPTAPLGPRPIRMRIKGMVEKGVVMCRIRERPSGVQGLHPCEYKLWEPES